MLYHTTLDQPSQCTSDCTDRWSLVTWDAFHICAILVYCYWMSLYGPGLGWIAVQKYSLPDSVNLPVWIDRKNWLKEEWVERVVVHYQRTILRRSTANPTTRDDNTSSYHQHDNDSYDWIHHVVVACSFTQWFVRQNFHPGTLSNLTELIAHNTAVPAGIRHSHVV